MIRRLHGYGLIVMVCLAMTAGWAGDTRADPVKDLERVPPEQREYLIKAAFLYNFARFTEWPAGAFQTASAPLHLCILGKDPFGNALGSLAGKSIRGHEIAISHVIRGEEARRCHLLFIGESAKERLREIFQLLDGRPVLTIADVPEAVRAGSVIGLTIVKKKIRFLINLDNLDRAGLRLSSRMLTVGDIVRNDSDPRARPNQAQLVPRQ